MKANRILTFVAFTLLALTSAQSLPKLTPPGAVGGLYTRNLSVKKALLVNFQAEWSRLGIGQMFSDLFKDAEGDNGDVKKVEKLLSTDLVGREGIVVFYPNGSFFVMARPSAERANEIIKLVRESFKNPKQMKGWLIEENPQEDLPTPVVFGVSSDALLIASKDAADRFFKGDRGLNMPISGDFAFWLEAEPLWVYLDDPNLGLPPEAVTAIKTFKGFDYAANLELDGIHSSGSACFDPSKDADLAAIFLPQAAAWPLGDLPAGVSATSGTLDLPLLGKYLTHWAKLLGQDMEIDLSAFGQRYALIDAGTPDPQQALQNPFGNLLLLLEAKDSLTAEVTLLSWLQMAAAFSTPEGQGGFSVEPVTIAGHEGKKVSIGMAGDIYLVSLEDRLALATSKKAIDLLQAPPLKNDPGFAKLAAMLPPAYVSASYGNYQTTLKQAAQLLPLMMMQTIDDAEAQAMMSKLSTKLSKFFDFVAGRVGGGISYDVIQGGCVNNISFTQVNW